ncbi:DUF6913 domain-containing protein [Capnocytophaga catalasegens]|uniref:DUF6913 domain-containing protein n=1 Tax=Capnocytophaga catalasegens TaxID=1004260 RepID=UPI00222EE814|nr:hypothetical protein [Capnocytophaga catalasegens]
MKFFKDKIIQRKIRKNLKNITSKSSNFSSLHIKKIACIVDLDQVSNVQFLENLIHSYEIRAENYIILGYKEQSLDTHLDGTPVFTWKDINFSGNIRNYHADRLSELDYDILINYFNTPKLPLLLLSSSIKAKLRIGFYGIDEIYNDLIISSKPIEKDIFVQEVKKVIQTIQ